MFNFIIFPSFSWCFSAYSLLKLSKKSLAFLTSKYTVQHIIFAPYFLYLLNWIFKLDMDGKMDDEKKPWASQFSPKGLLQHTWKVKGKKVE